MIFILLFSSKTMETFSVTIFKITVNIQLQQKVKFECETVLPEYHILVFNFVRSNQNR
jgi:hypothetical protein